MGAPASTWIYLVDDNPFESALKSLLTGHNIGLSVGAAMLGPIYIVGALYQRFSKR